MKKWGFFILLLAIYSSVFAFGMSRTFDGPPMPDLVRPYGEKVDLSGKDSLEFKWSINDSMNIRYCEFRLYKGREMYEDNLIYKQQVFSPDHMLQLKADLFEDGQAYSWFVFEVGLDGKKSDKAYSAFKVIKK